MVDKSNNQLSTDVYRKDTYTGLGLNYFSFIPELFKINSIKTLLHRAYNVCSDWQTVHLEIERLKEYFYTNSYPKYLIDKQ